jgi:ADP-dependent NAD(P)H-hydrate dehydratase / NAD(P)H-hydrate epimerase
MPNHTIHTDYWHQQMADRPLFPDVLWSRPERRAQAGKLLIIGGNGYGFATAAEAFTASQKAGIGDVRVVLPDALKRTLDKQFEAGHFVPSNPSGSFSQKALADILDFSAWADGVLIAGDLGRNSETALLLESFISKYDGQLTIVNDAVDYIIQSPAHVLKRAETVMVMSFPQLQKFANSVAYPKAFTSTMDLIPFAEALHEFSVFCSISLVVKHLDQLFVTSRGQVSTTKDSIGDVGWQTSIAAYGSVWWMQHQENVFIALSCAVYAYQTK